MIRTPDARISKDFNEAPTDHDVLVIGSGYGGGVAASRLARAGQRVTVLERGAEIRPGQYPKDMQSGLKEFQTTLSRTGKTVGKPYGLYDIRIGDTVSVFVGCGLGGTSLINANVAIEPAASVYAGWPKPYREDPGHLDPYFDLARTMLGSTPYPADRTLPKLNALKEAADGLKAPFLRPDINVTFEDGPNAAGVWQAACTDCGDCVSGCNYGAKNTVLMNYLADAQGAGAALFVGADVQRIRRQKDTWAVDVKNTESGEIRTLAARMVILAAGTLGSTEILLRSRSADLTFSDKLGHGFSTNGDIWAFGYNANMPADDDDGRNPVYCVGAGDVDVTKDVVHPSRRPGPCITGLIDMRDPSKPPEDNRIIEEGVMPGALAPLYSAIYPMIDALGGDLFRFGDTQTRLEDVEHLAELLKDAPQDLADTAYTGPVSRTVPYLVMGHDSGVGTLRMNEGRVYVDWPNAGKDATFKNSSKALRAASDQIKAEYLPMPMWEEAFNTRTLSVHPLGGCGMGDTSETGVVDPDCRVFDGTGALHPDLYVMDGSVIPGPVGVNPHLTITAVAERAVAQLARARGWRISDQPHDPDPEPETKAALPEDPADLLADVVKRLSGLQKDIDTNPIKARVSMKLGWNAILEAFERFPDQIKDIIRLPTTDQVMDYAGDDYGLEHVAKPLVRQCLDVLSPINDRIAAGSFTSALRHLERTMGDFSPPLWFLEKMSGHLTRIDGDRDSAHDPYGVAAMGPTNFEFSAQISADAVSAAVSEQGPHATIKGTARWASDALTPDAKPGTYDMDGTFRFLVENPDEIECWNMIYEGKLRPQQAGEATLTYRGIKTLQLRKNSHWWTDLTRLDVDILMDGVLYARGRVELGLEDVITQANGLEISYHLPKLASDLALSYDALSTAIAHNPREALQDQIADPTWRSQALKGLLFVAHISKPDLEGHQTLGKYFWAKTLGRIGALTLRTYGGFLAYMANFQSQPKAAIRAADLPEPKFYHPKTKDGADLRLTRYQGGVKGPVMMAMGMGANASGFATPTVDRNLVQMLVEDGFDVWLFDYRGSGSLAASLTPFDFDAVATQDWPAAIDLVLEHAPKGVGDVQIVTHCVGSLIFFMAMLAGERRVRSVISSQLGVHTLTNWFKQAQIDSDIARTVANGLPEDLWPIVDAFVDDYEIAAIAKNGMPFVDPTSPSKSPHLIQLSKGSNVDPLLDTLFWKVPSFSPVPCNSPTCHRVNFFLGPTYQHDQLNQATHDAIKDMFGPVSSHAFLHLTKCFGAGHAVPFSQDIDYMAGHRNLDMPIHFLVGAANPLVLPESSLRTVHWLKTRNKHLPDVDSLYTRTVYPGYGHIDCLIGKNAHKDIFPDIVARLNKTATPQGSKP